MERIEYRIIKKAVAELIQLYGLDDMIELRNHLDKEIKEINELIKKPK